MSQMYISDGMDTSLSTEDYSKSSTTYIASLGSEAVSNAFAPSSNVNEWVMMWVTCDVLRVRL